MKRYRPAARVTDTQMDMFAEPGRNIEVRAVMEPDDDGDWVRYQDIKTILEAEFAKRLATVMIEIAEGKKN